MRRNRKTSYCEIRKAQWNRNHVSKMKILGVVAYVQGSDHAAHLVDVYDGRLTEEEKKADIFHHWAYTSRISARDWLRKQHGH